MTHTGKCHCPASSEYALRYVRIAAQNARTASSQPIGVLHRREYGTESAL